MIVSTEVRLLQARLRNIDVLAKAMLDTIKFYVALPGKAEPDLDITVQRAAIIGGLQTVEDNLARISKLVNDTIDGGVPLR